MDAPAAARVNLSSGSITASQTNIANANGSTAILNHTGGTHTLSNGLLLATQSDSHATYNLSGVNSQVTAAVAIVG